MRNHGFFFKLPHIDRYALNNWVDVLFLKKKQKQNMLCYCHCKNVYYCYFHVNEGLSGDIKWNCIRRDGWRDGDKNLNFQKVAFEERNNAFSLNECFSPHATRAFRIKANFKCRRQQEGQRHFEFTELRRIFKDDTNQLARLLSKKNKNENVPFKVDWFGYAVMVSHPMWKNESSYLFIH